MLNSSSNAPNTLQMLQQSAAFIDSSSNSNGAAGNNKEDSLHIDMVECQENNPAARQLTDTQNA